MSFDEKLDDCERMPVHDSRITGLLSGHSARFLTTCSTDQAIAQCDLSTGTIRKRIRSAHRSHVLSMDCLPSNDENLFLSVGKDQALVTWDLRDRQPGVTFCSFPGSCPSAVSFCRNEDYFVIGTYDGTLLLFDRRYNRSEIISHRLCGPARVHRLKKLTAVTGHKDELTAIISDSSVVNVITESSLDVMYTDTSGSLTANQWIRDVEVIDGQVFSVGIADQQFRKHHISQQW